jgi:hypothetical protein
VKVHSFRMATVILAWLLIVAAFYQKPEALTGAQRLLQRGIEAVGDAIPAPWGPRVEFVFRENRRPDLASDHPVRGRTQGRTVGSRRDMALHRAAGSRCIVRASIGAVASPPSGSATR